MLLLANYDHAQCNILIKMIYHLYIRWLIFQSLSCVLLLKNIIGTDIVIFFQNIYTYSYKYVHVFDNMLFNN